MIIIVQRPNSENMSDQQLPFGVAVPVVVLIVLQWEQWSCEGFSQKSFSIWLSLLLLLFEKDERSVRFLCGSLLALRSHMKGKHYYYYYYYYFIICIHCSPFVPSSHPYIYTITRTHTYIWVGNLLQYYLSIYMYIILIE